MNKKFGLERAQWISLITLVCVLLMTAVGGLFIYLERIPDYFYSPTRYIFVTDKLSDRLDVVDLIDGSESARQDLAIVPDMLSVATDAPIMAYTNYEYKRLYFYNLKKKQSTALELPSEPVDLFFVPDRQQLLVIMKHGVVLADYQNNGIYSLANLSEIEAFSSLNKPAFSPLDGSLWISDARKKRVYRLDVNKTGNQWESFAINLPQGQEIGPISINLQGTILAFSSSDGQSAYIYDVAQKHLQKMADFREKGMPIAPFIDSNTNAFVFANHSGELIGLNRQGSLLNHLILPSPAIKIRGGWLNQLWVVVTEKGLAMVPSDGSDMALFSLDGSSQDVWVTGDGKTALITNQSGLQKVLLFDLQTRTQKRPIDLQGILQVNQIRMGGNNSFCY